MRFGAFITPNHRPDDDPTLALHRDLHLVEHLEGLGYAEAWFGEHHGSGWQYIASPETFIAAASQRTTRIRLGTGVAGLPFHHPLMLADRIVLLDHLSKGRVILGTGPGGPQVDAPMMGLNPDSLKTRHEEALETIHALLTTDEPIDRQADWFTVNKGRLQLRPYQDQPIEIVVSSLSSSTGPTLAGRFGLGMLSLGLLANGGAQRLADAWGIAEQKAAESGTTVSRKGWRLAGPRMHLAPTDAEARREVAFGLRQFVRFMHATGARHVSPDDDLDMTIDRLNESGSVIIGTPDRAQAYLKELQDSVGEIGCYLIPTQDWADHAASLRSFELFARFVIPHGKPQTASLRRSTDEFTAIISNKPGPAVKLQAGTVKVEEVATG
ncbi:MAG: LLM class flavin-dependent oxidoreductase [Rhodospirillaceae bacterium]